MKNMSEKGFSLVEIMVAIAILSMTIISVITLQNQSLKTAIYAKEQVVASFLAEDAIEYVRNKIDENVLSGNGWLDGLNSYTTGSSVQISQAFSSGNCTDYCSSQGGTCTVTNAWGSGVCSNYPGGWNRGSADGANAPWCHTNPQKNEWGNPGGDNTRCGGGLTAGVSDRNVICGCQISIADKESAVDTVTNSVTPCSGTCSSLKYDEINNYYNYSTGTNSGFTRTVKIQETVVGVEALVTVTMSWQSKGVTRTLPIKTFLYNWK